jgi:hypothetical protein
MVKGVIYTYIRRSMAVSFRSYLWYAYRYMLCAMQTQKRLCACVCVRMHARVFII